MMIFILLNCLILPYAKILMEFQFSLFTDPVKAFEHFTENKENYALVISDLRMPGLNGLELLKKVKTSNPKVRTILMSAYNFEEEELYQEYKIETVINSTIAKPITMIRLYQIVRKELDASLKRS